MNLRRKRMILMDGQWYGYLRTASGNPLNLYSAKRLRKLTIYGNAVQDGTPSPDAPVEVQLCGDRTGNLLDASTIYVKNSGGNVDFDGKTIHVHSNSTGEVMWFWTNVYVQQGKTYAIQYSDSTIHLRYAFSTEAITEYSSDVFANMTTIQNKFATFTATETGYLRIVFSLPVNTPDGTIDRLQVIEGSYTADTLPAYEPYGYKVSGRLEGLNLFNEKDFGAQTGVITNDDGSFTLPNKYTFTYDIRVESNSTYTLKTISNHQVPYGNMMLRFLNEDKQEVSQVYLRSNNSPYVLQTGNIKYIRISGTWSTRYTITFKNFQIVQGSYTAETMPPYEPYQPPRDFAVYLPEQIAKVGDVADEVVVDMEKQTAELKKNVGSVVADGDESWMRGGSQYDNVDYTCRYSNFYDIHGKYQTPGYFSNRFERKFGAIWNNPNSEAFNINDNQLHLSISNTRLGITADDESADRTTKFKAWLNDNNVTVYAPLAEPVTTDITSLQQWDAMPQVSGTVTLTLSAEVDPSGAEAVYYSKERGE